MKFKGGKQALKIRAKIRRHVQESGAFHKLMATKDIAEMLQLSEGTVRGMCKKKAQLGPYPIPYVLIAGRIMFYRHEILAWRKEIEEAAKSKRAARRAVLSGKRKVKAA